MLISLELKNFRQHENLTVSFTGGINAIRGANEAGKSTILEAILYALYGSKVLRNDLANVVTWGSKESTLSVKLTLRIKETLYVFTRSKRGAECHGDDGRMVTGQAEVTATAADLLGADAKVASLLMLASQAGLRGALDEGPTAVSGLMAKLADSVILDTILKNADERLALGSTTTLQQKLKEADDELQAVKLTPPDEEKHRANVSALELAQVDLNTALQHEEQVTQPAVAAASEAIATAEQTNQLADQAANAVAAASRNIDDLQRRLLAEQGKREAAYRVIGQAPGDLAPLREAAQAETRHAEVLRHYRGFQALRYPTEYWEGSEEEFRAALAESRQALLTAGTACSEVTAQARTLIARKITNGKCPTCGHKANSDEHVAAHNKALDDEARALAAGLPALQGKQKEAQDTVTAMEAVENAARAWQKAVAPLLAYVDLDAGFYPPRAAWKGAVPAEQASNEAAQKLRDAEARQRAADMARGTLTAAEQAVVALAGDIERATQQLAEAQANATRAQRVDLTPLKAKYDDAYAAYAEHGARIREIREHVTNLMAAVAAFDSQVQQHQQRIASIQAQIAGYEELIKATERNNVLVAKLKKIKPAITDHLWSLVLSAVSAFFSSMRGTPAVVTKGKAGFEIDGKDVNSYSGSTLDLLALAIRAALTKTFIPHAPFISLDEPAHGCTPERASNILGFLASSGFPQTLLASHDDLSEAVADNVIGL